MTPQPPPSSHQWFLDRDYSYTINLDPFGWFYALLIRSYFDPVPEARDWDWDVRTEDNAYAKFRSSFDSKDALWASYLLRTGPPPRKPASGWNFLAVKEIMDQDNAVKALDTAGEALIAIDLEATEGAIIEQFKTWLEERKENSPIPRVPLPGNPNIDSIRITPSILKSWSRHRILQLYDLLICRKVFDENVSDEALGRQLFHEPRYDKKDPVDTFKYSRKKLGEALKLVGALPCEIRDWGE